MIAKRLLLVLSLFISSAALQAATVEDRSPFRQGHWWNPERSGDGFEILSNGAGDTFVVWYTYDAAGVPTWYTAQGTVGTLGASWPLQKHGWSDGRIAQSTTVGSIRLGVEHFEKLAATWQVEGTQGAWTLEPFVQSGTINEVDLTGHWYAPGNSGWGMTLVDHIYTYEHADTQTVVLGAPSIGLASGMNIDGAQMRQLGRPASQRLVDYQLAAFARPDTLKAFIVEGTANRFFTSAGTDFSPAPPGAASVSFSTTNVQEAGVDEAVVTKSDGRHVYAIAPTSYVYTPPSGTQPGVTTFRMSASPA